MLKDSTLFSVCAGKRGLNGEGPEVCITAWGSCRAVNFFPPITTGHSPSRLLTGPGQVATVWLIRWTYDVTTKTPELAPISMREG